MKINNQSPLGITNATSTPNTSSSDTDSKIKTLAKITFSDRVSSITNSNFLKTAAVVVLTAVVALVLVGVLLTPPGWILAAAAVAALVIGLLILGTQTYLNPKTRRELSPLRELGFDEIKDITPQFTFQQKQAIKGIPPDPASKEITSGKIHLGTLPNKYSSKQRELFEKGNIGKVLSIVEEKELLPEFLSIPWSKKEFETAGITQETIRVEDHEPLTMENLNKAADEIYDTISTGKDVYVHCKAGQGRSPMTVAAYLIKYEGYTVNDAIDHVKKHREIASFEKSNRRNILREFADYCPIPPLKIDWNSGFISDTKNTENPRIFFEKKIKDLIEKGNKITIIENKIPTLLTIENYTTQLKDIPPHILMSLTESLPGNIYTPLQKTLPTIQMDSSFSTAITLTKLKNSFKVEGEFSISPSAPDAPETLESLHHISYSTTIPKVLDSTSPSITVECHKKPASKLEFFLCSKQREFRKILDEKTGECQTSIISSQFKEPLTTAQENNLRLLISNFLSKRTDFDRSTDMLVGDFLKKYPTIKNLINTADPTPNPNEIKYTTAANKLRAYEQGVILRITIKNLDFFNELQKDPETAVRDLHNAIQLDIGRGALIYIKEKDAISPTEDLTSSLQDIPSHIQNFLYQSLPGIILAKISDDSTLLELNIQPTKDTARKTPLSIHLQKINNAYTFTTDFYVTYLNKDNGEDRPLGYAKYSCKVTMPDTFNIESKTILAQLDFKATPIEAPVAINS